MTKGEKLDSMVGSLSERIAPKTDKLVERLGSKEAEREESSLDERLVLKYFPYFVIVALVCWMIISFVTGTRTIGDFLGNLCLVFTSGFAILGILFFRFIPCGIFPRWLLVLAAIIISEIQWIIGTVMGYMIYGRIIDSIFRFFGLYLSDNLITALSLLVTFLFTLFTTTGVLTVTVTYLRRYLLDVFKSMQIHAEEGKRGKAESFFMVPDIIDVRDIEMELPKDVRKFDSRSMLTQFVYMTILGTMISSYLFLNPYFLDVMSQKIMVMIMVMLCMFIPPLIIPWQSVSDLDARAVSDAPRDYRLSDGAKTRLFYTFAAVGAMMMMLMISFYFGVSLSRIVMNYVQFLIPLILTAYMYSFMYANNYRDWLLDYVSSNYNEWKCGEHEAVRPR